MPTTLPFPARRASRALLVSLTVAWCGVASSAHAADAVRPELPPLGLLSDNTRPTCDGPFAPFEASDLSRDAALASADASEAGAYGASLRAEVVGTVRALEFAPSATICSPTFAGLPGEITGSVASEPRSTRVGRGWRELGGSLLDPTPLAAGDTLTVPPVDDAAVLTLALAGSPDLPSTRVKLTDLAPGPSTVRVTQDARGLVATLTRADGTTAEAIGAAPSVPEPAIRFRGSSKTWRITGTFAPGTLVLTELGSDPYGSGQPLVRVASSGQLRIEQRLDRRRTYGSLTLLAVDRQTQTVRAYGCSLRLRRFTPRSARCVEVSPKALLDDELDLGLFYGLAGQRTAEARLVAATTMRLERLVKRAKRPARFAQRVPIRGFSAARESATVFARPLPRAKTSPDPIAALRPLAADINGDGATDFWSDETLGNPAWTSLRGASAGVVLTSSPQGMTAHRVDIPSNPVDNVTDSEISAIDDITGDGIGELVVDVDERHSVIPGSRVWTGTTAPIRSADLGELRADQIVLAPSVSSPGAPYATLDDATGDGMRELSATDDTGGWFSVDPTQLTRGAITRLPSVARAVPMPDAVFKTSRFDRLAPRVDPRLRVVNGIALAVRWPVVATRKAPEGTIEIVPRDARGTATAPATRVRTPGNAVVLDHDRGSGDLLLLSVEPRCITGNRWYGRCRETVLRVRADGTVRQSVRVNATADILLAGSARFLPDGPDTDADVDVVLGVGYAAVAALDSTRSGALAPNDIPIARLDVRAPSYDEIRPMPVFGADRSRKVFINLPDPVEEQFWRYRSTSTPAELVRK